MTKVFITGAFGNIGFHVTQRLLSRNHEIICFDLKNGPNEKKAKSISDKVHIIWGNLTKPETLKNLFDDVDIVIHLGAIIPPMSEKNEKLTYAVNVEGTKNIVSEIISSNKRPKLVFTSSISVFGSTQHLAPPRRVTDPVNPTDIYSHTKVKCEEIITTAGIDYAILRLGAANPVEIVKFDPIMFDISMNTRIEFIHPEDVALAIANTVDCPEIWGKTLLIGGGPSCQMYYKDFVTRILDAFGVGRLPEKAFGVKPFYTDWLDTMESQFLLRYQQHSFESYAQEMADLMGPKHFFVEMFRSIIRAVLLRKSPYFPRQLKRLSRLQEKTITTSITTRA